MTLVTEATRRSLTRPAWLLVASLPAFVAYLVAAITLLAGKVESSAELTTAQMSDLGVGWFAVNLLWVLPSVLAAAGLAVLGPRLPERFPALSLVPVLAAVAVALCTAYVVVSSIGFGFDHATYGESWTYPASGLLSLGAGWIGTYPATLLVAVALVRAGIARRTAVAIAAILALYWIVELLVYLPIIVGPDEFADLRGGLPPFLLGIFWAVLGGGVLRSRVPSEE
ncbi:hypothetical protein [Nocardioides humi]|uniref:DUF998 domain-containing protein n=1 Tax=Nocardioides humi TaxID=449461 RepID=A0ABN1ZPL0_9ACTN|nr:hypothetical protein [Nocardioides humi]